MSMRVAVCNTIRCVAGVVAIAAFACGAQAQTARTVEGPCGSLFGAKVCTSYRTEAGKVTEFSMRVPITLIEQAPPSAPMVWPPKVDLVVPFANVVNEQTGFTFSNIYWNPVGHTPKIYSVPHFDFHFYFVPAEKLQGINCKDNSKPQVIPAGYALPDETVPMIGEMIGMCVPQMGMHAVPNGDLTMKGPWGGSLVVGYYSGKPMFIEPMITKALLMKKHSFSLPIPAVEPTAGVRYPRRFNAVYHPQSESYDFTFSY